MRKEREDLIFLLVSLFSYLPHLCSIWCPFSCGSYYLKMSLPPNEPYLLVLTFLESALALILGGPCDSLLTNIMWEK